MANINGGQLLARCLANEGVRFLFGLPSPEIDPMLAALEDEGIRLIPFRHEAAGAHMAEGLYKTTGQVAAVLGNPGPGSANLLPGVITARHEGVPLVAITSQHRLGIVYPSSPATFQGQDQLDVFRPAVKWSGPLFSWNRIPEVTAMAFREMWAGRPGPVHLELPGPVVYEEHDEAEAPILSPTSYRAALPKISSEEVEMAVELLLSAQRPVVVAGAGADRAGAREALTELVHTLGCPVMATMSGRSAVGGDDAHSFYGYGPGADLARCEADVVLAVGTRLGNLDVPFDKYWGDSASQKLIQIDVDPRNMGVTRPLTLGIVADATPAISAIARTLRTRVGSVEHSANEGLRSARAEDVRRYAEAESKWRAGLEAQLDEYRGEGIHPARALQAIGRVFGADAIYVTDGGNTSLWAHWFLPATRERSYLAILELGMLGTGIPSALGAKLGSPDRDVVCVTGDGAAGFNFMEMQSAARESLAVKTVVFADGAWTMEEPNPLLLYGRTFGSTQGKVRWDKVAEGLGCTGVYAERLDEVEPALVRARDTSGPVVVCLRTDRDANRAIPADMMMRFTEVYQGPMG